MKQIINLIITEMSETAAANLLRICSQNPPEDIDMVAEISPADVVIIRRLFKKLPEAERWNIRATLEDKETYQKYLLESAIQRNHKTVNLLLQQWRATRRFQETLY